jgi:sugar lactone lactonase YvrE
VLRYRIAAGGGLEDKRDWADCSVNGAGESDGMALDTDGNLYVAHYGGSAVIVFRSDGTHLRTIPVPGRGVTNVEFGGGDLRFLYITETETNQVFRGRVRAPGLPLFFAPENTGPAA